MKNKIYKNIEKYIFSITILLLLLDCAGNLKKNKEIKLKLWHIWTSESDSQKIPFEDAVKLWNEQNKNIQIEMESFENEVYKTKLKTAAAANRLPDIFFSWGAGFIKPYIDSGRILYIDEYIKKYNIQEDLIGGALDYQTFMGKTYGLSFQVNIGVFYCNTELFQKYNIKIPETYKGLISAVKTFRLKGITPITVGEKDRWPGMFYYDVLALRTAGADLCNKALNKEASFKEKPFVKAAYLLDELVKLKAFDDNALALTRDDSEKKFKEGKIPMYFNGSWIAGGFKGTKVDGKIIVKKFPSYEGNKESINDFFGGAPDAFWISANTKFKDEAFRSMNFIVKTFSYNSYINGSGIPTWKVNVDESEIDPLILQIVKLLQDARGFTLWWDIFLNSEEAETHKDLVAKIFAQAITPEKFTDEMQKLNIKEK